jgi:hypothetical protein
MAKLIVAAMAAFAFTTAWAGDTCEAKDMPCKTVLVQSGSESDEMSAGSASGEPGETSVQSESDFILDIWTSAGG